MSFSHLLTDTFVHMPPQQMLADLSPGDAESKPASAPHSIAEIVAHLDFWQTWFLKRCRGEAEPMVAQAALGWPSVTPGDWPAIRDRFVAGLRAAAELGSGDVSRRIEPAIEFPPLAEYTIHDALVHLAMHNSHHLGQVVLMRQMLRVWPPPSGSWTW